MPGPKVGARDPVLVDELARAPSTESAGDSSDEPLSRQATTRALASWRDRRSWFALYAA
jgi:hypothetical protein